MPFRDYSTDPDANTIIGESIYIGPNMARDLVRPALQQLAADGKDLSDDVQAILAGPSDAQFLQNGTGAVTRTVLSKLREDVSVKDFGTVANNVTNDSPAIQATLDAAKADAVVGYGYGEGGGEIIIPKPPTKQPYYLAATLDIKTTVRMRGPGHGNAGGLPALFQLAPNITGIRQQYYGTTGDTGTYTPTDPNDHNGSGSTYDGLAQRGAYNGTTNLEGEYHAWFLRSNGACRDYQAWNMQGDAIHIHAGVALPESGNANCWLTGPGWSQGCRNGHWADGGDANQGISYGEKIGSARWWGFYNNAGIQSLYIAPLTQLCGWSTNDGTAGKPVSTVAFNGGAGSRRYAVVKGQEVGASTNTPNGLSGAGTGDNTWWYWYEDGGVDAFNVAWFSGIAVRAGGPMYMVGGTILHGYMEGGQPPCQFGGAVLRIGGTWGGRVIGGAYISASANQVVVNDFRVTTGNITLDDDGNGVLKLPRLSAANPYAYLQCSSASGGMLICSPNGTVSIEVTNASVQSDKDVNINTGKVLKVGAVQVVGPQGAAVPDAAALTSVNATNAAAAPTQAEFNAFVAEFNKLRTDLGATRTQLNTALARLRAATGHGLIA